MPGRQGPRLWRRRCRGDRGAATVTIALAVGFVLILVVQAANVIVQQYGKGTVQAALDEGVRAAARTELSACEERAEAAISDLAAGMAKDVDIECRDTGTRVVATAEVRFPGWILSITDYEDTLEASAAKEDR